MASFDHVDADGTRAISVALEHRLVTLQAGGRLRLVLGNLSPGTVHHLPWVHPVTSPFSVALLLGGPDGLQATPAPSASSSRNAPLAGGRRHL